MHVSLFHNAFTVRPCAIAHTSSRKKEHAIPHLSAVPVTVVVATVECTQRLHADQLALGIPARHLRHAIVRMFDHLWVRESGVRESGVQSNGNNRNKADTTTNQAQTHGRRRTRKR